jgi:putative tryptophan/tyrosine transport system substrate-binding protein
MKNILFIITALLITICLVPFSNAGNKALSIQSTNIKPYEDAITGFQSTCNLPINRFVISEMNGRDIVQEIRKAEPSIILCLGMDALEKIKGINDIPVVYIMIPNSQAVSLKGINFTGVRMNIAQEAQLSVFLKAVPSVKNIGLVYNPENTGYIAQRVIDACTKAGIKLVVKETHDPRETPRAIKAMAGKIDGFWMLPDSSVFTSETTDYLFLFSIGNRVPILTFSEIYLKSGALISIGVDTFNMGSQAGEMAQKILSGKPISSIPPVDARKEVISINSKVSEKLGIHIDEKFIEGSKFLK